jgi:hypothetical protein
MISKATTFAQQLKHFAKSVDIVDDEIFDRVRALVYRYVRTELQAAYFELLRDQTINGRPGVQMFWSSSDREHSWTVRVEDGSYHNPICAAFDRAQPVWIVNADRSPLGEHDVYDDHWSRMVDLTPYQPSADQPVRTLVVVPLRRRRMLGAYYFECPAYIGITDVAKAELQLLGDALAILLDLYETNRAQSKMTGEAILELQERLESSTFPRLTKPRFFVAFSSRADASVTMAIQDVLKAFSDRIEFTDWSEMNDSGNISAQLVKEITRSRFGICYLSEPVAPPGDGRIIPAYRDNPNVLFEAGMLHALSSTNASTDIGEPAGWIPVREADSPPAPFDFAAERTVTVPRSERGEQDDGRLRAILTQRVHRLLGGD